MKQKKLEIKTTILSALEGRTNRLFKKVILQVQDHITKKHSFIKNQKSHKNTYK